MHTAALRTPPEAAAVCLPLPLAPCAPTVFLVRNTLDESSLHTLRRNTCRNPIHTPLPPPVLPVSVDTPSGCVPCRVTTTSAHKPAQLEQQHATHALAAGPHHVLDGKYGRPTHLTTNHQLPLSTGACWVAVALPEGPSPRKARLALTPTHCLPACRGLLLARGPKRWLGALRPCRSRQLKQAGSLAGLAACPCPTHPPTRLPCLLLQAPLAPPPDGLPRVPPPQVAQVAQDPG